MTKKPTITERGTVEIEHNGKKYTGRYEVEGRRHMPIIKVTLHGGDSKRASVRGMPIEGLARILLRELVGG